MEKLCVVLVIALAFNQALAMNLRQKRQSNDDVEDLDDRYGWDSRPVGPSWGFPGQSQRPGQGRPTRPNRPGQGQFPNQGQFPGQGQQPGQGQFPGQGQQPGQGQFPGQGQQPGQGQFPGQGQQPEQGQFPGQGQQTLPTTQAPAGSTTVSSVVQECIRTCPVTPEYNPVCGTDNVTYTNPGRLICAQNCGTVVSLQRTSPCPVAPSG